MMERRARRTAAHPMSTETDFDSFVRNHCVRLIAAVFRTCGDETLAEDAVQNALVQLQKKWHSVLEPSKWVYKVALRRVQDAVRSGKRRAARESSVALVPQQPDIRNQPEDWVCMRMQLDWMLRELSFKQRAVIAMWSEGMAFADIADILGTSEATVRSHKCQAMKQLRRYHATTDSHGKETKR